MNKNRKALLIFYAVSLPLSALLEILCCITQDTLFVLIAMWVPGITAIILASKMYKGERILGLGGKFKIRYILIAMIIPLIYLTISYAITWLILKDPLAKPADVAKYLLSGMKIDSNTMATIILAAYFVPGIISSAMSAAGEEIGWRGFAYPLLEKEFGRVKACLINGIIWALWHFPMMIGGAYQASVNMVYGLISFVVCVMLMTVIFCWTRSVSASVWPAIMLHAVHNHVDQIYLQPLSTDERVPYFAGEQGFITIILIAVIVAAVIVSWRKTVGHPGDEENIT
ncbi:CAAX protease self-immunity [Ruminococcaceae bacterium YRB3002]|nr:CAAX protease self-immunity [Ruminococcaceae bacterium YRB3002]